MRPRFLARLIFIFFLSLIACAAFLIMPTAPSSAAAADAASTPTPTITPQPAGEGCPVPAPAPTLVPRPTVVYRQACITIEDSLPADLRPGGALVLRGDNWRTRGNMAMYHLDLMSLRKSPFLNFPAYSFEPSPYSFSYPTRNYAALSPDGKWLAYLELSFSKSGNEQSRVLKVANAEGRFLDMAYWGLDWQYLVGWRDEKHLVLEAPKYPGGDYLVLNPFTTHKEVLPIDIPYEKPSYHYYLGMDPQYPSPSLSHWLVRDDSDYSVLHLMQRDGWQTLWEGDYSYRNTPGWSPNGRYFTVQEDLPKSGNQPGGSRLLLVGLDGKVGPLTNPVGSDSKLAWSPDGRFLAGWMQPNPQAEYPDTYANNLALIDVEKPLLTDLCFENQKEDSKYSYIYNIPPVWSPDGRFIAVAVSRLVKHEEHYGGGYTSTWTETSWDTVIIDLQTHHAYRLVNNYEPLFWMKKPK